MGEIASTDGGSPLPSQIVSSILSKNGTLRVLARQLLGHAMNQLVDKLWVEAALKDPAAKFQEGDVVAIEAKTSCLPTASIVVNCHWEI